jgi:hypothetical protein
MCMGKYFVCSMKDKLMVLDVKLTSCSLVYPITKVSRIKSHVYVGSPMHKVSCASCVQSHVESPVGLRSH